MEAFLGGFEAVLSVFILIVLGYVLTARGRITEKVSSFLSWFVVNITLPCYMFQNVLTSFDPSEIKNIPGYVAFPFLAECIGLGLGFLIVRLFKVEKSCAGSLIVMTALNNTIFMGLPVNLAMFGEQSTPFVLYYYMANTILFWTVGVYIISGGRSNKGWKQTLKKLVPPPLYGLILGIGLLLYNTWMPPLTLPKFIMDTLKNVGGMTTPLSMIFIGYVLASNGLKNIRFNKNIGLGLAARFLVGPAIALTVFSFAPLPGLMKNVFTVQAFMPVMANQSITAEQYGADPYFPAVMVSLSTIASLLILPLVRILL